MQSKSEEEIEKKVKDLGGRRLPRLISHAVLFPAHNKLCALFKRLEQLRDRTRIVLQVGVHRNHNVALSDLEPRHVGRRLAIVAYELEQFDSGIFST